jgi:hypothetical protein
LRYVGLAGQKISLELGGVCGLYRRDFSRRKLASTADPMRHYGDQQKGGNAKIWSADGGGDSLHVTPNIHSMGEF